MGKTALATDICRNVAKRGHPVLFFTMEMTKRRVAERIICAEARVPVRDYRRRRLTEIQKNHVDGAIKRLWQIPLTICEGQASLTSIRSKAMQEKHLKGLRLVVIDYLTLIDERRTGAMSQNDLIGTIANKLQLLSKDLNIPVITVSQLSRECERRTNKRPILSDLRDSGNIEQAGDKVLFVYRDEYYYADTDKPGIAEVIVAKNKDGPTGTVELGWVAESATFTNLTRKGVGL
jgi:replicative DNA helicase